MTNKDLKKVYDRLNARFFEGRLPEDASVHFEDLTEEDDDGVCRANEIAIHSNYQKSQTVATLILLHEMIHLELPNYGYPCDGGHGMLFQHRLVELFYQGAYDGLL